MIALKNLTSVAADLRITNAMKGRSEIAFRVFVPVAFAHFVIIALHGVALI